MKKAKINRGERMEIKGQIEEIIYQNEMNRLYGS